MLLTFSDDRIAAAYVYLFLGLACFGRLIQMGLSSSKTPYFLLMGSTMFFRVASIYFEIEKKSTYFLIAQRFSECVLLSCYFYVCVCWIRRTKVSKKKKRSKRFWIVFIIVNLLFDCVLLWTTQLEYDEKNNHYVTMFSGLPLIVLSLGHFCVACVFMIIFLRLLRLSRKLGNELKQSLMKTLNEFKIVCCTVTIAVIYRLFVFLWILVEDSPCWNLDYPVCDMIFTWIPEWVSCGMVTWSLWNDEKKESTMFGNFVLERGTPLLGQFSSSNISGHSNTESMSRYQPPLVQASNPNLLKTPSFIGSPDGIIHDIEDMSYRPDHYQYNGTRPDGIHIESKYNNSPELMSDAEHQLIAKRRFSSLMRTTSGPLPLQNQKSKITVLEQSMMSLGRWSQRSVIIDLALDLMNLPSNVHHTYIVVYLRSDPGSEWVESGRTEVVPIAKNSNRACNFSLMISPIVPVGVSETFLTNLNENTIDSSDEPFSHSAPVFKNERPRLTRQGSSSLPADQIHQPQEDLKNIDCCCSCGNTNCSMLKHLSDQWKLPMKYVDGKIEDENSNRNELLPQNSQAISERSMDGSSRSDWSVDKDGNDKASSVVFDESIQAPVLSFQMSDTPSHSNNSSFCSKDRRVSDVGDVERDEHYDCQFTPCLSCVMKQHSSGHVENNDTKVSLGPQKPSIIPLQLESEAELQFVVFAVRSKQKGQGNMSTVSSVASHGEIGDFPFADASNHRNNRKSLRVVGTCICDVDSLFSAASHVCILPLEKNVHANKNRLEAVRNIDDRSLISYGGQTRSAKPHTSIGTVLKLEMGTIRDSGGARTVSRGESLLNVLDDNKPQPNSANTTNHNESNRGGVLSLNDLEESRGSQLSQTQPIPQLIHEHRAYRFLTPYSIREAFSMVVDTPVGSVQTTKGGYLLVHEKLEESLFNFSVPLKILDILLEERQKQVQSAEQDLVCYTRLLNSSPLQFNSSAPPISLKADLTMPRVSLDQTIRPLHKTDSLALREDASRLNRICLSATRRGSGGSTISQKTSSTMSRLSLGTSSTVSASIRNKSPALLPYAPPINHSLVPLKIQSDKRSESSAMAIRQLKSVSPTYKNKPSSTTSGKALTPNSINTTNSSIISNEHKFDEDIEEESALVTESVQVVDRDDDTNETMPSPLPMPSRTLSLQTPSKEHHLKNSNLHALSKVSTSPPVAPPITALKLARSRTTTGSKKPPFVKTASSPSINGSKKNLNRSGAILNEDSRNSGDAINVRRTRDDLDLMKGFSNSGSPVTPIPVALRKSNTDGNTNNHKRAKTQQVPTSSSSLQHQGMYMSTPTRVLMQVPQKTQSGGVDALLTSIRAFGETQNSVRWLSSRVDRRGIYVKELQRLRRIFEQGHYQGRTFKRSVDKKSKELAFLSTNLHLQTMSVQSLNSPNPILHHTVTVGAFSAHSMSFSNGGIRQLVKQVMNKVPETLDQRVIVDSMWEIQKRMDMVFSQATAALMTGFVSSILKVFQDDPVSSRRQFRTWVDVGYLFSVESLLSSVGKESGMLGDKACAVAAMSKIHFRLLYVGSPDVERGEKPSVLTDAENFDIELLSKFLRMHPGHNVKSHVRSSDKKLLVTLRIKCASDVLPFDVRGKLICVTPVLFTQGINEMQTAANLFGAWQLQKEINMESLSALEKYYKRYREYYSQLSLDQLPKDWSGLNHLDRLMSTVHSIVHASTGTKCVQLLEKTSDVCRELSGGRVTCCKSAKDRTSMSVTLEQFRLLRRAGVSVHDRHRITTLMRSHGVRIANAKKNIGKKKYCFNQLQNWLLPTAYKCPKGLGGGVKS
eukprot:TRINITY_DN4759_c0_g6_i1.p1 TRINITY_DN4759_c0_g6~~TRINITY_DN4759_c0_g6_i1.p1  ORF type:complete len:1808 (+),score=499.45 TRINITY_DN4759_c0_g6_i1:167-5590(+)